MFQKTSSFCRVLVLAVAAVLLTVTPSQASPRGGFRHGGFHGGFHHGRFHHFHGSRFHHGFFPRGGFHHGFFPRGHFHHGRFHHGGFHHGFLPRGRFWLLYGAGAVGGARFYPGYYYGYYPYYNVSSYYDDRYYGELAPSVDRPATAPSDSAPAQ